MLKTGLCLFIFSYFHLLFLTMPMSLEEQQQLMSLLQKAQAEGVAMETLQDTLSAGRPSGSPPGSESDFSVVQSAGAMTDAAKRREATEAGSKNVKRIFKGKPTSKAADASASTDDAPAGYTITWEGDIPGYEGGPWTAPKGRTIPFPVDYEIDHAAFESNFPDGVSSLAEWGRTLVSFGQFANQSVSYHDLISSTDSKKVGYVRWCKSRTKTAGGLLKDFCEYVQCHELANGEQQGPMIPGTEHVRKFKS